MRQVRVSSLYELEPLPLRAALDAIGGDARAKGKLPLRLMQAEVDRLLEQMPKVPRVRSLPSCAFCPRPFCVFMLLRQLSIFSSIFPSGFPGAPSTRRKGGPLPLSTCDPLQEGKTQSPVRAPGSEKPTAPDAPSYPSAYEPPPLNDRYQAAANETLSPVSPVPPTRSSINTQPYVEATTTQGAASHPSGRPKSPRSSRSQNSNSKSNNNEERYEMTVYGERHRVRREYDPIPDEDDGYVCNGLGGVPADYD